MEDRTNVWRVNIRSSGNKERYVLGKLIITITFCVSTDTNVTEVEKSKGRLSVGRSMGKS